MVRKYLWLIGLCMWFLLGAGPAQAENPLQALYKAAKAEGEVILWSPVDAWEVRLLAKDFNKEFPGIKVNHFEIREDDYVPRVVVEAKRGIVSLDIAAGRYAGADPLLVRDLIRKYDDWTEVFKDLNPVAVSGDGRALTWYHLVPLLSYNTKLLKSKEVPTSWDSLLAPKWKGKIIVEPRAMAFAYVGLKWGKKKMVEYLKKLKAQDPIYVKGGTGVAKQLAAGAAPLAIGAYIHKILQMRHDRAPIDWVKISPLAAASNNLYVMKGAPHPNAAKLFMGWLASNKAQKLINKKLFRGALNPGSSYLAMQEIEMNNVEVVRETMKNYKQAAALLNKAAVAALGVLR